jgi:hypothetical protein
MNAEEKQGRKPPRKLRGQCKGPRRISGQILDIHAASEMFGGTPGFWRSRIERRDVPFHRLGGRIVFIRSELERFFTELPGCSLEEAKIALMARRGDA